MVEKRGNKHRAKQNGIAMGNANNSGSNSNRNSSNYK